MKHWLIMISLGMLAGAVSYGIVARLQSPWSEVIAALLIGAVPGVATRSLRNISGGLLAGTSPTRWWNLPTLSGPTSPSWTPARC